MGSGSRHLPDGVLHRAPVAPERVKALKERLSEARDEEGCRSYAMLLIFLSTGMRVSELVGLKITDFRRDDLGFFVSFYRPKRRDRHTIRLSLSSFVKIRRAIIRYHRVAMIERHLRRHVFWSRKHRREGSRLSDQRTKLVARSVQRIVNSWSLMNGLGQCIAPHGLRHHVGRQATRNYDFIYAQKLLGHADPKTTAEFYTDRSVQAIEV